MSAPHALCDVPFLGWGGAGVGGGSASLVLVGLVLTGCLQSDVTPSTSLLWVVAMGGCYGWLLWVGADWVLAIRCCARFTLGDCAVTVL